MFEDNNSCIDLSKSQRFSPRTKHTEIMYHNFRQYAYRGELEILPIDTVDQTGDIFTKPLNEVFFPYLRQKRSG